MGSCSSRTRRVAAIKPTTLATTVTSLNHDLGWILLAFAIFNIYMLILSTQVNLAVFLVFLILELTVRSSWPSVTSTLAGVAPHGND